MQVILNLATLYLWSVYNHLMLLRRTHKSKKRPTYNLAMEHNRDKNLYKAARAGGALTPELFLHPSPNSPSLGWHLLFTEKLRLIPALVNNTFASFCTGTGKSCWVLKLKLIHIVLTDSTVWIVFIVFFWSDTNTIMLLGGIICINNF